MKPSKVSTIFNVVASSRFSLLKLFLSIVLSIAIALSVKIGDDELGALWNLYLPVLIGLLTILILLIFNVFVKAIKPRFVLLISLITLNLLTGVFEKITFNPFLEDSSHETSNVKNDPETGGRISENYTILGNKVSVENLQSFVPKSPLLFSLLKQTWSGSKNLHGLPFNLDKDKAVFRLRNLSAHPFTVKSAKFSKTGIWVISSINSLKADDSVFPIVLNPGCYADVSVCFTAAAIHSRVSSGLWGFIFKMQYFLVRWCRLLSYQFPAGVLCLNIKGNLTLNAIGPDNSNGSTIVPLRAIWQYHGEGDWEPDLQTILNAEGFGTKVGFKNTDGRVHGNAVIALSDEISATFFVRSSDVKPVKVTQIAAYHGCCLASDADTLYYYSQHSPLLNTLFRTNPLAGQMLMPNVTMANHLTYSTINSSQPFGFKCSTSYSDRKRNYQHKIGIRVWKAIDIDGKIIPNGFILGSDYLGKGGTNYDYQDDVYFLENVKPLQ